MWFRRTEDQPNTSLTNKAVPPKSATLPIENNEEELQGHVALCEKIGALTPAVRRLQLERFLAKAMIPVYDSVQVDQYLGQLLADKHSQEKHIGYAICPLREKDECGNFRWFWDVRYVWDKYFKASYSARLFPEIVPTSVLKTVEKISAVFPDAKFLVTSLEKVPDPFLLVTFEGQFPFVVDFWNEPGFKPA